MIGDLGEIRIHLFVFEFLFHPIDDWDEQPLTKTALDKLNVSLHLAHDFLLFTPETLHF
jgi:hypothetical protein